MARKNSGNINFDINIQGVKDAQELSKTMPELVKQFNQLARAVDRVEKTRGGTKGSVQDVKERIVMMNVGFIKKEINSLQQLGAEYGSIVNQINALERQGKPVARLREQAIKQHERLRKKIRERTEANKQLQKSEQSVGNTMKGNSGALNQKANQLDRINQKNKQVNQDLLNQPQYMRNASYVWLNAGYLIQDSPYGVRGMANNVSQLTTAWQLMNQRLIETNAATGQSITAFGALKNTIMGPTGVMLLLGSLLPAALVLLDRHWDKLGIGIEETRHEMEDLIETMGEYIQMQRDLDVGVGKDPLGLRATRQELEEMTVIRDDLQRVVDAVKEYQDLSEAVRIATSGGYIVDNDTVKETRSTVDSLRQSMEELKNEFGAIAEIDLDELEKEIEEVEKRIERTRSFLMRSPAGTLQSSLSASVQAIIEEIELMDDPAVDEALLEKAQDMGRGIIDFWEIRLRDFISSGQMELARVVKTELDRLRDALDEDESGDGDSEPEDWFEDQYEARQQMMDDLLEMRVQESDRLIDNAYTTEEKINEIKYNSVLRAKQLHRQEFDSVYERELAIRQLNEETKDKINQLTSEQVMFNLEMQNLLERNGIDNASSHQEYLSRINAYYDRREQIIRESVTTENQLKEQLFQNDQRRRQAEMQSEQKLQDAKLNLAQQTAQGIIHTGQAIANATNASARAQFEIQKISSASMAIINARLAFTKTLASGGYLATPLAYAALASGVAQAAAIMTQSFDGARATGSNASFSGLTAYRGFDFGREGSVGAQPFQGSRSINTNASPQKQTMPDKVRAEFTDGFGRVVSEGTIQLQNQNKEGLGYWSG